MRTLNAFLRDALTVAACCLVLVLATALIVPRLIDWTSYRSVFDDRLAAALDTPVRSEGAISVTLLPTPALRFQTVHIGIQDATSPRLNISGVQVAVALMPLLKGEVRITQASTRFADALVVVGPDGTLSLPAFSSHNPRTTPSDRIKADKTPVSLDRLVVTDGRVSVLDAVSGTTNVFTPVRLTAEGTSLSGPWRVEGVAGASPFRLSTGAPDPQGGVRFKFSGGGDRLPRLDLDGALKNIDATPRFEGRAVLVAGPPVQPSGGVPVSVTLSAVVVSEGRSATLSDVKVSVGEGDSALVLRGSGHFDAGSARHLALDLHAAFIDVDRFALSPSGAVLRSLSPSSAGFAPDTSNLSMALDVSVDTATVMGQDVGALAVSGRLENSTFSLKQAGVTLPGESRVTLEGEERFDAAGARGSGRVSISSQEPDRLAGFLNSLGGPSWFAQLGGDKPFQAQADLAWSPEVAGAHALRWISGEASITGAVRYTPADPQQKARPRVDAQLALEGIDLAALPALDRARHGLAGTDFGLTVEASRLRYRNEGAQGRLSARLTSGEEGLHIETLELTDIAGANASASGTFSATSRRIEGRISAEHAAPLATLLARLSGVTDDKLAPLDRLLDAPLKGTFVVEANPATPLERTQVRFSGSTDGAGVEMNAAFRHEGLEDATPTNGVLTFDVPNPSAFLSTFGLNPIASLAPGRITVSLKRNEADHALLTLEGDAAGVRVLTESPFDLTQNLPGRLALTSADIRPLVCASGCADALNAGSCPLALSLGIGFDGSRWSVLPKGRIGAVDTEGNLVFDQNASRWSGTLSMSEVSFPTVASLVLFGSYPKPSSAGLWPADRFASKPLSLPTLDIELSAKRFSLGFDVAASDAQMHMALSPDAFSITQARLPLTDTVLSGSLTLRREAGRVALSGDIDLANLLALGGVPDTRPVGGVMPLRLHFGSNGENVASLVANLSGGGDASWRGARIEGLDPTALSRIAASTLAAPSIDLNAARTALENALGTAPFLDETREVRSAPATLSGGVLRITPLTATTPSTRLEGDLAIDLKTATLNARGTLVMQTLPPAWTEAVPQVDLSWKGALVDPKREIDTSPFMNGLAAIALKRDYDRLQGLEKARPK